jgi:hypothetical protein
MTQFTFSLVKSVTYRKVRIDLFTSTDGYFVETSQGLISDYFKTKKEATSYIANAKRNIKIEAI